MQVAPPYLAASPPSPTLPQRKSGLPDLRTIRRDPGKPGARGGGSTPNVRQQQLVARLASLAEPRERVGSEAAACVDCGGARLRVLDPALGRRARIGRKLRQLGDRAGK